MPHPDPFELASDQSRQTEIERRKFVRYVLDTPAPTRFLAQPGFQMGKGLLKDVALSGFCLIVDQSLPVDARLVVRLPGHRRGSTLSRSARVLRVEPDGEGSWLVGCQLSWPLSDEEMSALRASCQLPV